MNIPIHIKTFKYAFEDVNCQLCTEYVKKLGCTSSSQHPLVFVAANGENFLPPNFAKGGLLMSTSEVLQLCPVIIGICSLFIQAKKK